MLYHRPILYLFLFLINFHYSIELTSSINGINSEKHNENIPLFIHRLYFISYICQRQKQYPLKIIRKFCSTPIHSYKSQEEQQQQQQRGKRVGWTISV